MIYLDARPLIRSGDLLAWSARESPWASWHAFKIWLVRLFTRSEFSHVGTAWCVGERVFVIEAVRPAVRIMPLSKTPSFYWLPLHAAWGYRALNYALAKVGEPYSQLQAVQALFGTPADDERWECAELAARCALQDGIDLGSTYTPAGVVERALAAGASLTLVTHEAP